MDPVWVVVLLCIYVSPTLLALVRQTPMVVLICVLNVFLGWTIIGWFAALALAMLLPRAGATAPMAGSPTPEPGAATAATTSAISLPPAQEGEFQIDPMRVAALSLFAPLLYQYWWLWRFFKLAQRERFPRSRSFWWIFVPLYGYAVIGRLFHDLQSRLGPARPSRFNAQVAVGLIVAANVSAGWGLRFDSVPFIVGGLALSCVFTAMALYQVQVAVNAYLRTTYAAAPDSGFFAGEVIVVVAALAMLGLLVLGAPQPSHEPTAQQTSEMPYPVWTPTPTATPTTDYVLRIASEPGDLIGRGQSMTMVGPAWRFVPNGSEWPDTVYIAFDASDSTTFARWSVWLAAPRGQELHVGTYVNAEREASRTGSAPGIDVSGDGRSCNKAYGSFTVTQVTIGHSGKVLSLEATFEQHCESPGAPALRGYVKFAAG